MVSAAVTYSECRVRARLRTASSSPSAVSYARRLSFADLSCFSFSSSDIPEVSSGRPSRAPLAALTFFAAATASSSRARARVWNRSRLVSQAASARWAEPRESSARFR